jgi:hypothetical protein
MSERDLAQNQGQDQSFSTQFGEPVEMEDLGFTFSPISGFELEIDGSVYMYSEDVSFEVYLMGGRLPDDTSIAELNNILISEIMENVDHFEISEIGIDTLQGMTGFLNEIRFINVEEEGMGHGLICSPFINQYFFLIVLASKADWQRYGTDFFFAIKSKIRFHPQFKPAASERLTDKHFDLTIETYDNIAIDEDFVLTIKKGDGSFLLAARSISPQDYVWISDIIAPDGSQLYHYDSETGEILGALGKYPLAYDQGEVCFFFPPSTSPSLTAGNYIFNFATKSGSPLQEVQVIIRSGRALDLQKFDINFWAAVDGLPFKDAERSADFQNQMYQALKQQLLPHKLTPGQIELFQPAPDELIAFRSINTDTDLSDCSYMVVETVNNHRALNIALVEEIINNHPASSMELKAVSAGSPGMLLSNDSPHACIIIEWTAYQNDLDRLANVIVEQLILFSGIDLEGTDQKDVHHPILNHEIAWRLRRHPVFYNAD